MCIILHRKGLYVQQGACVLTQNRIRSKLIARHFKVYRVRAIGATAITFPYYVNLYLLNAYNDKKPLYT